MVKFCLLVILVLISSFTCGQETVIYEGYPYGQEAYVGGNKQLYKDIHQVLLDNKFEKCIDSTQSYKVKLIVKQDASILFVKNSDSVYIHKNKCAYELSKQVLKYLTNWKAAEHKTGKLNAMYEFDFFPSDLFENYEENYIGIHIDKSIPQFPGGIEEFRKQFQKNFNTSDINFKGTIKSEIFFSIGLDGSLTNIIVKTNPYNSKFEKNILEAIKRIKGKWILPKSYSSQGKPYQMRFPISFNFE